MNPVDRGNPLPGGTPLPPIERDVPHWAISAVAYYRKECKLPKVVTGRMIYARLLQVGAQDPATTAHAVCALKTEYVDWIAAQESKG